MVHGDVAVVASRHEDESELRAFYLRALQVRRPIICGSMIPSCDLIV